MSELIEYIKTQGDETEWEQSYLEYYKIPKKKKQNKRNIIDILNSELTNVVLGST